MKQLNSFITDGTIVEKRDSSSLFYLLQSPQLFFMTGYKVLQSQEKKGFVRCNRIMHNGKDKLVYDISKYKSLETMLPGLRPEIMTAILGNIFDVIIEVKNNGFLQCRNIEITLDKIFIDCNNYKVYLVYLPIHTQKENGIDDYTLFENLLKENLIKAIQSYSNLISPMIRKLCDCMRNSTVSMEMLRETVRCQTPEDVSALVMSGGMELEDQKDIYHNNPYEKSTYHKMETGQDSPAGQVISMPSYISRSMAPNHQNGNAPHAKNQQGAVSLPVPAAGKKEKKGFIKKIFKSNQKSVQAYYENMAVMDDVTEIVGMEQANQAGQMRSIFLIGIKTPEKCRIEVTKAEFIIGKNSGRVDYTIGFNRAVSGVHCKLMEHEGSWYLMDLESTNGTFLNGVRLLPNQPAFIKSGDKIRIANSDFSVK